MAVTHSDYNDETTTANNLVLKAEKQNDVSDLEREGSG